MMSADRHRRGISLLEILLSLLIFGVCLIPIFSVIGKTTSQARSTRDGILAMQLAGELVDQVCGMPFRAVPTIEAKALPNEDHGTLLAPGKLETMLILSTLPPDFERVLTIEEPSPRCKLVRCTIFWGRAPRHESRWQALMEWNP